MILTNSIHLPVIMRTNIKKRILVMFVRSDHTSILPRASSNQDSWVPYSFLLDYLMLHTVYPNCKLIVFSLFRIKQS